MVRRSQGRRADRGEAIHFLEHIRDHKCATLVLGLLYSLPGQTLEIWREDLGIAEDPAPDDADLYGFNVIPETPLHRAVTSGKLHPKILQHLGTMCEVGAAFLGARGCRQISNSHHGGRTSRERNLYNLCTKQGAGCLAMARA